MEKPCPKMDKLNSVVTNAIKGHSISAKEILAKLVHVKADATIDSKAIEKKGAK